MSTIVLGFRQADERWNKMKLVWVACEEAGLPAPKEVKAFFNDEYPGNKPGIKVCIKPAVKPYMNESEEGFEIDVTKLPTGVTTILFYNSW